ncbi:ubiquinone biosynthesis accessory factor UbiJ [Echinimonas agarilytica]|uniref:SCP2 sterol-binding domain-containing protein n=1 Tax=Echinimonas agarilytica TaxID=1215918 RepID=A0AA42B605_9GAMM|nr:SCP2 sterol-binding domain-containing protein [Echinimonas agarilytica]MCM2678235.1 SCP2 sterol-binding domain-containing protein [Echinimonas agarilytica]
MIKAVLPILLSAADRALGVYQSQHSMSRQLKPIQGESLLVELTDVGLSFVVRVDQRLHVTTVDGMTPSCMIRGKVGVLTSLKDGNDIPRLIKTEALELEGNLQVASQIAQVLSHTHFDSEEWLSQWMGDVPAYTFMNGLNCLKSWLNYRAEQGQLDLREWLQDEAQLLPVEPEVRQRKLHINQTIARIDDLAERVAQLQQCVSAQKGLN